MTNFTQLKKHQTGRMIRIRPTARRVWPGFGELKRLDQKWFVEEVRTSGHRWVRLTLPATGHFLNLSPDHIRDSVSAATSTATPILRLRSQVILEPRRVRVEPFLCTDEPH